MTEHLHPDDIALLLGAIFHAPASGTFPPNLGTVATSMGNGAMFRLAAQGVSSPASLALARKTEVPFNVSPRDLPSMVGEGGVLFIHMPSVIARMARSSSYEEQEALLEALVSYGTLKARALFEPWLNHAAGCPALTGMLCNCGLDEVGQ